MTQMSAPAITWHSRPIFISSTFRDMHAERDYLRSFVFPELEERLKGRRCYLEPVDLRWGVETISTGSQEAKELLVLKVCLAEIERSRPFMVVLLGDRYGWVPPGDRIRAAAREAGFDTEVMGKSVTALEIEYGALRAPDQMCRTFFYFREPLPYDEMDTNSAARFSDEYAATPESKESHLKLTALKSRIEQQVPDRIRRYRANWDVAQGVITDLEEFGKLVLEDLWSALDEETSACKVAETKDWREQERWLLEQFVEERSRNFVGREEETKRAIEFAVSGKPSGKQVLCFIGEPGVGKSGLFARLYGELKSRGILLLASAAGVSSDSVQIDRVLHRWAHQVSGLLDLRFRVPKDASGRDLDEAFANLLHHASLQKRLVLLVDALNQFTPSIRTSHMTWLARLLPENVRVIATSTPGSESGALETRTDSEVVVLSGMTTEEGELTVHLLCGGYHRTPHADVVEALLSKKRQDGQAAAGNPLWLSMAVEELNLLDEDDFARSERDFAGTPEERLHQLLLGVIESMPADVQGLYAWMLRRAEDIHGESWARGFVNLIAASRYGWRESDLRALMPVVSEEPWSDLRFAALRRSMRTHLAQRGAFAQWDFCHTQLREAALSQNLSDSEEGKHLHSLISDYLESLSRGDPMRETELMFHYIGADDKARAARLYADPSLSDPEIQCATKTIADHVARSVPISSGGLALAGKLDPQSGELTVGATSAPRTELTLALEWVLALLDLTAQDDDSSYQMCHRVRTSFVEAVEDSVPLAMQRPILEKILGVISDRAMHANVDVRWMFERFGCQSQFGSVMESQGDVRGAIAAHEGARSTLEDVARQVSQDTLDVQENMCRTSLRLGDLHDREGDALEETGGYRDAYSIALHLYEEDSRRFAPLLSHCICSSADRHYREGDEERALSLFEAVADDLSTQSADQPQGGEIQNILCDCWLKMGRILCQRKDFEASLAFLEKAKALADNAVAAQPYSREWIGNLSIVLTDLSITYLCAQDLPSAWECGARALKLAERLTDSDPGDVHSRMIAARNAKIVAQMMYEAACSQPSVVDGDFLSAMMISCVFSLSSDCWGKLSFCHGIRGYQLLDQGDTVGAKECHKRSLVIPPWLHGSDGKKFRQLILHNAHHQWGVIHEEHGDLGSAVESFQNAVTVAEQAHADSPDDQYWQAALWSSLKRLADVFRARGDLDAALENYRKALATERDTVGDSEASGSCNSWLCHVRIGDVLTRMGGSSSAIDSYNTALEIARRQSALLPDDDSWQRSIAVSLWNLTRAHGSSSHTEEAARCRQECLTVLRKLKEQCGALDQWASQTLTELDAEFPDTSMRMEPDSHDSN